VLSDRRNPGRVITLILVITLAIASSAGGGGVRSNVDCALDGWTTVRIHEDGQFTGAVADGDTHVSPSLSREVVGVLNVPNRTAILFHHGNEPENSVGCILVGTGRDSDTNRITGSVNALESILTYIDDVRAIDAKANEVTTITIRVVDPDFIGPIRENLPIENGQ
jgi:hypothetical protein